MQEAMLGNYKLITKEIKTRVNQMAANEGFLLCVSNHVQRDVPPKNLIFLYKKSKEYGRYNKS